MESTDIFSRSQLLLGSDVFNRLQSCRVIIFGIGGVGSWAAEALVRTGLRHLTIVDFDTVAASNINRQMPATTATVGMSKVEAAARRLLLINPMLDIECIETVYNADTASRFRFDDYDYVIDAIDSLGDKALLINNVTRSHSTLFSSMGAALKLDPCKVAVTEFRNVTGCRLAAALRRKFKRLGVFPARKFKSVYSPEIVENKGTMVESLDNSQIHKSGINGSLMQITCTFGMTLASLVIDDLIRKGDAKC